MHGSPGVSWILGAPGFYQRVEVQCVGEIEELIAQPTDLRAGGQGDRQRGVEHGAARLGRQIGVASQAFKLDMVIDEELAQLVEDVRAIDGADVGDVRKCLWS